MTINEQLAEELGLKLWQIEHTVALIDEAEMHKSTLLRQNRL